MTERVSEFVKAILACYKALTNKNFVDKLPFPNRLAQHALELLDRIPLRDVLNRASLEVRTTFTGS